MVEPLRVSIRQAFTGELLCEWARSEVGELRVWELKQRFCQVTASAEYFAWQLHNDRRPLKDYYFVSSIANNMEQGLHLFATKRRDDECETVKGLSDDGHSYAGTVVRGVLRGDSE